MLKPALARGEIQCIGATTLDEYRKNIEKDGALERRFQKVIVDPTTAEETLQILQNIKARYEEHHNVIYTPEALQACVKLTERYISDRNFPDKAIDALDEAGSRVHISNITVPKSIRRTGKPRSRQPKQRSLLPLSHKTLNWLPASVTRNVSTSYSWKQPKPNGSKNCRSIAKRWMKIRWLKL